MLYTATTFKYVFDHQPGDVFWCTADVGWITGHSYVCYGPLGVGATGVIVSTISTCRIVPNCVIYKLTKSSAELMMANVKCYASQYLLIICVA